VGGGKWRGDQEGVRLSEKVGGGGGWLHGQRGVERVGGGVDGGVWECECDEEIRGVEELAVSAST